MRSSRIYRCNRQNKHKRTSDLETAVDNSGTHNSSGSTDCRSTIKAAIFGKMHDRTVFCQQTCSVHASFGIELRDGCVYYCRDIVDFGATRVQGMAKYGDMHRLMAQPVTPTTVVGIHLWEALQIDLRRPSTQEYCIQCKGATSLPEEKSPNAASSRRPTPGLRSKRWE